MSTPLIPTEANDLSCSVIEYCADITEVIVRNPAEHEAANEQAAQITKFLKDLKAKHEQLKKPHLEAGRKVDAWYKEPKAAAENAKKQIAEGIMAYEDECERKRQEEQRKADEEAAKERKRAEELADKRRAEGKDDLAEKWEQKADEVTAPVVSIGLSKSKGRARRKVFKAVVEHPDQVVRWAILESIRAWVVKDLDRVDERKKFLAVAEQWLNEADGLNLIAPDEKALNLKAKEIGEERSCPGWRIKLEQSLSYRSGS